MLFPNTDLSPNRRLVLTREEIAASNRTDLIIHIAVIVRYSSGQKVGRTIRLYDVQHIPGDPEDEAVVSPQAMKLDDVVRQDRVWLSYYWMPNFAD